jgi:phosphohistidine swiveling domain-containing protein
MLDHASALAGCAREAALWAGKSATLDWLSTRVRASRIPAGIRIDWSEWRARRTHGLERIRAALASPLVVARSDRADEDDAAESRAGRYRSCLDVRLDDTAALAAAVDAVFASYGRTRADDGVLIQEQIAPVRAAIVASTHGLPDGAPYYALSVSHGARSDAVTRGDGDVETWYVARDRTSGASLPEPVRACLDALIELETLAALVPCEGEIVLEQTGLPWVVQLRRLPIAVGDERAVAALRRRTEADIVAERDVPLLGMMPDWNPAELLGEHPRPLALDIFDRVIARRAWRLGRSALGYSRRNPSPLLRVHAGRPYVDVAASFRSLLPAALDDKLGERLVAAWIARLEAEPALHDKVEFDVAMSAVVCRFDATFDTRHGGLFTKSERNALRKALLPITRRALDASLTLRLGARFATPSSPPAIEPLAIRQYLGAIERGIAAAFATAARQAFVAEALLRAAVDAGALTASRLLAIKRTVETIATEFHAAWSAGGGDRSALMQRFGRQRAGTFELCAPTLTDVAASLADADATSPPADAPSFSLDPAEIADLSQALDECGLALAPEALVAQYARAVRARELGKFALADRVSAVLEALACLAQQRGIGREEAGWLSLDALLAPHADGATLSEQAHAARELHALESQLRMPLLIGRASLDVVAFLPGRPNFLGHGRAHGRPVVADAHSRPEHVPLHAMLAIASADPGFEWMFLHRPAAIVTAYGGPNSHIAIRCVELGIPALLGVGPEAFRRIASAARLMIDFDTGTWSIA